MSFFNAQFRSNFAVDILDLLNAAFTARLISEVSLRNDFEFASKSRETISEKPPADASVRVPCDEEVDGYIRGPSLSGLGVC